MIPQKESREMLRTVLMLTDDEIEKEISYAVGFDFQDARGVTWLRTLREERDFREVMSQPMGLV